MLCKVRCKWHPFDTERSRATLRAFIVGRQQGALPTRSAEARYVCAAAGLKTATRKASSVVPIISLVNDSSLMPATLPPRDSISDGIDSFEHSTLLIGIDPGTTGAVATLLLDHATANRSVAHQLEAALVSVFDMPVTETPVHKRTRRETCPIGFAELVRQLQAGSQSAIHAVMEEPAPNALNGKQSWYGCGYAYGTCKGVLSALGVPLHTVTGRLWKSHLALNGLGKEGSRSMALNMLPQAAKLISRKKDHGRAEALLIAAWALGARQAQDTAADATTLEPSMEVVVAEAAA